MIIDDSYNASPASVAVALSYLAQCHGKKIFVLGDLGELGDLAEQEHEKIGILAKELKIDLLFAIGNFSKYTLQAFYDGNTETNGRKYQQEFADKQELCNTLLRCIQEECQEDGGLLSCTILIKGSNFMEMWEVTDRLREMTNN
jgi:UDP-N-acetylmuramoyl-tripeptide--D-alanyl-D-alanine ligase